VVAARIQTYTVAIIAAVLFGLGVLIGTVMTRTAEGQAAVDQEKINRQLEQVVKALDSGDIAAAVEYLKETVQGLPDGVAKTHLSVAINALQYSNDTKSPRMHVQLVQDSLQNSTG
jgi:uncharacterized membrane-anchored protein YhcB (DUF1043 family)